MNELSLNKRILTSVLIVFFLFAFLMAAALNEAFKKSTNSDLKDKLYSQLYAIMANTELEIIEGKSKLNLPSELLDSLLGLPQSGLYAQIIDKQAKSLWQSDSSLNQALANPMAIDPGEHYIKKTSINNKQFFTLYFGVEWYVEDQKLAVTFILNQDLKQHKTKLISFRNTLWLLLAGMTVCLLLVLFGVLRWGLKPLRQVADEMNRVETGSQDKIINTYPTEIDQLTQHINQFLKQEQQQKKKYRDALGDLAHSLKTPLAVIQSSLNDTNSSQISEQVQTMNSIVEYQLQRAATAGKHQHLNLLKLKPVIQRITHSLDKIHQDKNIRVELLCPPELEYKIDEGDSLELFGNLIENAYKWSVSLIKIDIYIENKRLIIEISDDGKGFPQQQINTVLQRGKRADESAPGHGIGLSIVNSIVESYEGSFTINNLDQGAIIKISLNN